MKIYVDENDYVITYCDMTGRESLETSKSPIIVESLSEYTKQVRAEVVEEIKEKFNTEVRSHFCPNPSCVDFITLCISEVEEFLEQVKGESNVKD